MHQTKQKSIEDFKKYIDELINTKYIFSNKKLNDLMRSISNSKLFYSLFKFCTEDFDYERTFTECFVKGERYGQGKFNLPKNPKDQIAFIFSLLFLIDTKEVVLVELLEQYFYINSLDESYRNFTFQVLVPFKNEVLRAAEMMAEDEEIVTPTEQISHGVHKKTITSVLTEEENKEILRLLDESRSIILQYKIENNLKAELMELYNFFKEALYDSDPDKMRVAYLGYKYATLYHRKLDGTMLKIENILRRNNILH